MNKMTKSQCAACCQPVTVFAEAKLKLVDKIHSDFRVNLLDWKNKHGNTVVHESFKKER